MEEKTEVDYDKIEKDFKSIKDDEKFYFVPDDCKSYTLNVLFEHILSQMKNITNNTVRQCTSPGGNDFLLYWRLNNSDGPEIIDSIKQKTFIDWSRTSNEKICPISCDNYENPVILNMDGRTYSFQYIKEMIEKSLIEDENLRLESVTLTPSHLQKMILYPHKDLGKTIDKPFSFANTTVKIKLFQQYLVEKHNIPEMNSIIGEIRKNHNKMWDYIFLWDTYAKKRGGLPMFNGNTETIQNLILEKIKFPKEHPKCDTGHLLFKNILFKECEINISCFCGVDINSSLFENCTIDLSSCSRSTNLKRCIFKNCNFLIAALPFLPSIHSSAKHSTNMFPENILLKKLFHNCIDNIDQLENCTVQFFIKSHSANYYE